MHPWSFCEMVANSVLAGSLFAYLSPEVINMKRKAEPVTHCQKTIDENIDTAPGSAKQRSQAPTAEKPSFFQKLQRSMAAIAYAEMGEHAAATQLLDPPPESKAVLLVIDGEEPDPASFTYALNLCRRNGNTLDILHVLPSSATRKVSRAREALDELLPAVNEAKVPFRLTLKKGDIHKEIIDYVNENHRITMVILDSCRERPTGAAAKERTTFAEALARRLAVPLSMVRPKSPTPA